MYPEDGTAPIPGLMLTVFAPVTAQFKVVLSPNVITVGLREKALILGGLVGIVELAVVLMFVVSTVTVTDLVTPLAIKIYVVVAGGVITMEPLDPTPPMPWLMLIDVEPMTSHVRVELSPA
jgi:hypothetical protein